MHSLRTRITLLTVWMIIISVTVVTMVSVFFIRHNERREAQQLILLLCETGERNLDYYFNSVQKSVGKVSAFVEEDLETLDSLEPKQLSAHMERVGKCFDEMAYKANGVLTYYYRIDPAVSDTVKGFWFTNLENEGFVEHEVTDITLYDTEDTSKLVWFTVPKHTSKPIWLPPYITDNLDKRVISYNEPIYWRGQFIGVVGIEIDYSTMAEQVDSIRLYRNGYAFLSDAEGNLYFHPRIDVTQLTEKTIPKIPDGALSDSTFFQYTFQGVQKQAVWLPLSNGMRMNVTVPVSETEGDWQKLIREIILISLLVLLGLSIFTLFYTGRITKPLKELTKAAEQVDKGDYDFTLNYDGKDEVGRLTSTFKRLTANMKDHISDLNKRAYVDALTSVRNKGAFSTAVEQLQGQVEASNKELIFAIGVFDCDNLKLINDKYGHDKGDIYLKTACQLICRVFAHSPVFRIGGDEFAVILRNDDYNNREALSRQFEEAKEAICRSAVNRWEQVSIAMGIAVYDPEIDFYVVDTVRRADKIMYANKRQNKKGLRTKTPELPDITS
ncbi:MAG: diguanylate cyclase [Eubacterium sp.]|nr:diguanylate cyclase [Eubacterium sp.]